MIEFCQNNFIAVILLLFLILVSILLVALKIDLKKDGKYIALGMIVISLIAGLLLMQETELKAILTKVFVIFSLLFGCFVCYRYLKLRGIK